MNRSELEDLLARTYGWELKTHRSESLAYAIRQRISAVTAAAGVGHLSEEGYLRLIAANRSEFVDLLEELVVNESWFQREPKPIEQVASFLLSRLAQDPSRQLRILSAPCSCGEEPVTVAAHLIQRGISPAQFHVDAIDLSAVALERARQGLYSTGSFRVEDELFRTQVFERVPDQDGMPMWCVRNLFRQPISYHQANIFELPDSALKFDVIFCRNLLIYFNESARLRLFDQLSYRLRPQGVLVVAACEFALPPAHLFHSVGSQGIRLFHKRSSEPEPPPRWNNVPIIPGLLMTTSDLPRNLRSPSSLKPAESQKLTGGLLHKRPPPFDRQTVSTSVDLSATAPETDELLNQAERAADEGRLEDCAALCRSVLVKGPHPRAYFLLSLVFSAQQKPEDSESHLRRALYLDPDNRPALLQIALLRERAGDLVGAERFRQRLHR